MAPVKSKKKAAVKKADIMKTAEKVLSRGMVEALRSRGADFLESGGEGAWLFDEKGNRYLDCYSSAGAYNLGRRNGEIVAELRAAAREIDQGNFVMLSAEKASFGERLAAFLPGKLECVLPGAVRGEALDAACKLARGFTGRAGLVTVNGGWYGQTGFALTLSQREDRHLFGNLIPEVSTVPFGDIDAVKKAVTRKTAAFIMEPVQAENHCRAADAGYLVKVREICRRKSAMLILDETQTGFGRTGSKFAFEDSGVEPDILVFGEAITGGVFPMTGIAFPRKLKSFFDAHPLIHMSTFGGHDIGCRVACRALDEYDRIRPWQNAMLLGMKLADRLRSVMEARPNVIRSMSGKGLLVSLAFRDAKTAAAFCAQAARQGVFAAPGEVARHCVVLRPPLTITSDDVDFIANAVMKAAARL